MANEESKQGSKREFWRAIVDRYDNRAAGVTLEAFCRREDVNASTMFQWRRRFQAEAEDFEPCPSGKRAKADFSPTTVGEASSILYGSRGVPSRRKRFNGIGGG
jgi:transposase-like protein